MVMIDPLFVFFISRHALVDIIENLLRASHCRLIGPNNKHWHIILIILQFSFDFWHFGRFVLSTDRRSINFTLIFHPGISLLFCVNKSTIEIWGHKERIKQSGQKKSLIDMNIWFGCPIQNFSFLPETQEEEKEKYLYCINI